MARRQEIQKPTTLLISKKTKLQSIDYDGSRGEIMVIIDANGIPQGDVRIVTNEQYTLSHELFEESGALKNSYSRLVYKTMPIHTIGSLIYYAGTSQPNGYLFCNGSWVMAKLYYELYEKLKNSEYAGGSNDNFPTTLKYWGGNDNIDILDSGNIGTYGFTSSDIGELVFKLPDLRGFYIRNHNQGRAYVMGSNNHPLPEYDGLITYDEFGNEVGTEGGSRIWGSKQYNRFISHLHTGNEISSSGDHTHLYAGAQNSTGGFDIGVDTPGNDNPTTGKTHYATFGTRTMTSDSAGAHRHFGWVGYGSNYSDTGHITKDHEGNDSADETRPKSYQLMVCIKY